MSDGKTCLLDVNVLVALCDPLHLQHEAAHTWFSARRTGGWATCPITENGFVRVAANPSYPNRLASAEHARKILRQFTALAGHVFWKDGESLRDSRRFSDLSDLPSSGTTDVYLLGLAVSYGGKLATLDRKIPTKFVVDGANALELIRPK